MDYKYPKIRLGLCCLNMTLKYTKEIQTNRRRILATIKKKGLKDAMELSKDNVVDILKIILWNKNHGIDVLRISSELVPHGTNEDLVKEFGEAGKEYLSLEFLRPYLKIVGKVAKLEGIRLTFHPGQFVQIGSPNLEVYRKSVLELAMHTKFLDMMQMPPECVIVFHIGGVYNDRKETIKTFLKRFEQMDESIKRRVVLENDEKCYGIEDVLYICETLKVPTVFDYFHHVCFEKYHPDEKQKPLDEIIPRVLKTWTYRNIRPKFHLSEQMPNKPVGSHSLFIENIPDILLNIPSKYNTDIDIMIEAKGKEVAIGRLYEKYPQLKPPYTEDLPTKVPRAALKDLKLPDEIKELPDCFCETQC